MEKADDLIKKLKKYFEKRDDIVMAFIFGSQAKGRAYSGSDWDIAVYFRPISAEVEWEKDDREYREEGRVLDDCINILKSDNVDLIVLNRSPANVSAIAITTGIPLVIKDRKLWLEFMLIITQEAEDFRRTAKEYADIYWRSASLSEEDAYALNRRLIFLDSEFIVLQEFSKFTLHDYENDHHRRRELERLIENIMNATIDICKILLASEKKPVPSTYKEIVRMAGGIPPFSSETAERLSGWTELRNILAHEYLDIRWHRIEDFIRNSEPYLKSLIQATRKILESKDNFFD